MPSFSPLVLVANPPPLFSCVSSRGRDAVERLADRRGGRRRRPPGSVGRRRPVRSYGARAIPRDRHEQLLPAHAAGEQRALAGQPAARLADHVQAAPGVRCWHSAPALLSSLHQGLLADGQLAPSREALLQEQSENGAAAADRQAGSGSSATGHQTGQGAADGGLLRKSPPSPRATA